MIITDFIIAWRISLSRSQKLARLAWPLWYARQCCSGVEALWFGSQILALFCFINSSRFKTSPPVSPACSVFLPQAGSISQELPGAAPGSCPACPGSSGYAFVSGSGPRQGC